MDKLPLRTIKLDFLFLKRKFYTKNILVIPGCVIVDFL